MLFEIENRKVYRLFRKPVFRDRDRDWDQIRPVFAHHVADSASLDLLEKVICVNEHFVL